MSKILLFLGEQYFSNSRTGVGQYHANLINSIKTQFDLVTICNNVSVSIPENCNIIRISPLKRKIISVFKWILPVEFFFKDTEIVISDSFSFYSFRNRTKLITIVHDCMAFTEPKNYKLSQKLFAFISSCSYKRAKKIIAVSETTKQTMHVLFHIPYNKIDVVPNISDFRVEIKNKKNYLFIGDMRKTKNLEKLILGFMEYKKDADSDEALIIAGSKKNEFESLYKLVCSNSLQNSVLFPGYISIEDKKRYFSEAKGFVFLSDNEGFGIPLLESAMNKIPVMCSDIPVFHEVLSEEYAYFVNNKDIFEIANGFRVLNKMNISENASNSLKEKYSKEVFMNKLNSVISKL